jgi:hypothetical protein
MEQQGSWSVITVMNEPQERKAKLITEVATTTLGKEEMAVCL